MDWQERLVAEHADITIRLVKLKAFISGELFNKLDHNDRSLLWDQLDHMKAYRKVLNKRIRRFNI